MSLILPAGYVPKLVPELMEQAIFFLKEDFQEGLAAELNLRRVTAPLFVLSGTGAGDTSIAAFLMAAAQGKAPAQCAALAAAEGACAVTAYDALSGLKQLSELEARIASGWETM